jgi:hypothetical protein
MKVLRQNLRVARGFRAMTERQRETLRGTMAGPFLLPALCSLLSYRGESASGRP